MTDATRIKVERTRSYLLASQLPEDTKDGLQTLLDAASNAANGTQDRIGAMADAILALSLHEVRQAVRTPLSVQNAVSDAVAAHLAACPVAGSARQGVLVAIALKPWPWLFAAVAVFSPYAPKITEIIANAAIK